MSRYRVTYASGRVRIVFALSDKSAQTQAAFYSPGDEVLAVLRVG
jgi:hypothetical protein